MTNISQRNKPTKLYRGQELQLDFISGEPIDTPEESFRPRSTFGAGKTISGMFIGDAVFATDSYNYASLYTIPKIDEFSAGFIGYNINQNFLIISHYAKVYYDNFPEDFGYVYSIENTESFSPVIVKGKVAEWYSKKSVFPTSATKINGLDDIAKHNQILYLSPTTSWRDWEIFSLRCRGKVNEIYRATERGFLRSYNQERGINSIDFSPLAKEGNIFKRLISSRRIDKQH